MAIPEPTTQFDLWPRVKAITGWPDTDETAMVELFFGWLDGAEAVGALKAMDLSGLAGAWPDTAGQAMESNLNNALTAVSEVEGQKNELGGRAGQFALEVEHVKNYIPDAINQNLIRYGLAGLASRLPLVNSGIQIKMVHAIAGGIITEMNATAARIRSQGPVNTNQIIAELAKPRSLAEYAVQRVQDHANKISALSDVAGDTSLGLSVASDAGLFSGPTGVAAKAGFELVSTGLGAAAITGHVLAALGGAKVAPETLALDTMGLQSPLGVPVLSAHFSAEEYERATGNPRVTVVDDYNNYWMSPEGPTNPVAGAVESGEALDQDPARVAERLEERARSRGQGEGR